MPAATAAAGRATAAPAPSHSHFSQGARTSRAERPGNTEKKKSMKAGDSPATTIW